jgi:AAA domain
LIGRQFEIDTIMQSMLEDKAHVVLYSERGRGKTSLSNIIVERLKRKGLIVVRYQCEASTTFDSFMRGLVRRLPESLLVSPVRTEKLEGCEAALPGTPLRPDDVLTLLPRLRLNSLICVIDELDRIVDPETRTMLADTIKQLSDRTVPLLFLLIGVSDNLEQLLGQHPSIQRALVSLPLPLLSDEEIGDIVEKGAKEAGLTFPGELVSAIVTICRGMPYLAHVLGLRVAQAAARRNTNVVKPVDLVAALDRLVRQAPSEVLRHYDDLTADGRDEAAAWALRVIATCPQDAWGVIRVIETPGEKALLGGQRVSWSGWLKLCEHGVVRRCFGDPGSVVVTQRSLVQHVQLQEAFRKHASIAREAGAETNIRPIAFGGGTTVASLTRSS